MILKNISMEECQLENKGYIALLLAIIILFLGVGTGVSLIFLNTAYSKNILVLENSLKAENLLDLCYKEALYEIYQNYEIVGDFEKDFQGGHCTYSIYTEYENKVIEIKARQGENYCEEIIKVNTEKEILSIE